MYVHSAMKTFDKHCERPTLCPEQLNRMSAAAFDSFPQSVLKRVLGPIMAEACLY